MTRNEAIREQLKDQTWRLEMKPEKLAKMPKKPRKRKSKKN